MAVSSLVRQGNAGNFNANTVIWSPPTTASGGTGYITNGILFKPADVAMGAFDNVIITADASGVRGSYDYTNQKIVLYVSATGVEVANGVNLSAVKFRITCIGQ